LISGEPDGVATLAAAYVERGAWNEALDVGRECGVRGAAPYLGALAASVVGLDAQRLEQLGPRPHERGDDQRFQLDAAAVREADAGEHAVR
jgi:hypothetical protein